MGNSSDSQIFQLIEKVDAMSRKVDGMYISMFGMENQGGFAKELTDTRRELHTQAQVLSTHIDTRVTQLSDRVAVISDRIDELTAFKWKLVGAAMVFGIVGTAFTIILERLSKGQF